MAATERQLSSLHLALYEALRKALKDSQQPPAELLAVVRAFLADNGIEAPRSLRPRLRALHGLALSQLEDALRAEAVPSPSLLREARLLSQSRVEPSAAATTTTITQPITTDVQEYSLPFRTKEEQ
jgi:maltooligosyltrehalose synthase